MTEPDWACKFPQSLTPLGRCEVQHEEQEYAWLALAGILHVVLVIREAKPNGARARNQLFSSQGKIEHLTEDHVPGCSEASFTGSVHLVRARLRAPARKALAWGPSTKTARQGVSLFTPQTSPFTLSALGRKSLAGIRRFGIITINLEVTVLGRALHQ